jgi:hypothetical protein
VSYIGVQPTAGQYRKLDNISASFNGSTTSFTTSVGGTNVTAGTAQQLLVSVGGVIQEPNSDYTVSTNTITFTTAPASGLDFFAILMGDALNTVSTSDGSITTAKLAGSLSVGLAAGTNSAPSLYFTGDSNTGVYSPGSDQVAITTGGTGRLFIDSSGRLLVGTSTARSNFFGTTLSSLTQTEGTGGSTARGALSVINNDVSNNPAYVLLGRSGAATLGSNAAVVSGSRLGTLTFHGADGTSFIEAATVAGEVDGTPGTNDMPGRLVFSTTADGAASPTERLRITSAGLVGIGTNSPARQLDVNSTAIFDSNGNGSTTSPSIAIGSTGTGLSYIGSQQLAFLTNSAERARIDSSGRLLVGTSSAATGTDSQYSLIHVYGNTSGNFQGGRINIGRAEFSANITAGEILGDIYFSDAQSGTYGRIECVADGTAGANDYPGRLVFSTTADGASSPTEAMRITSNQNICIGSGVDDSTDLTVATVRGKRIGGPADQTIIADRGVTPFAVNRSESDNVSRALIDFYRNGANPGSITATNTATAYNTSSDYRLKENVVPLTGAVDRLNDLQVHRFNFIADPDTTVDGFLAHEAQAVVPECATGNKDEVDDEGNPVYQGIDQSKLVPLLTAALQETIAELQALKAEVAALKGA